MWGPLAVCQIIGILVGIWRDLRGDESMKIPKVSEVLKWIALPVMSDAVKADDEEREALELLNFVKKLKARNEQDNP